MIDKVNKAVELFQEFFDNNFTHCDQGSVEILLMLAYGHMFDIFTPNQLIQTLGLEKTTSMTPSTPGASSSEKAVPECWICSGKRAYCEPSAIS